MYWLKNYNLREAAIWLAALLALAFYPFGDGQSLCVFSAIGVTHCPGCGLGRGIHLALIGKFGLAHQAHFFAIPAVLILVWRILTCGRKGLKPVSHRA